MKHWFDECLMTVGITTNLRIFIETKMAREQQKMPARHLAI
jgi:hypothetical protein